MGVLLKHQPWTDGSETDLDVVEWNMWQRRQPPYHHLAVGSRLVLVSGGGPTDGMLTWQVEVAELVRGWYNSHAEAWDLVRHGLRDGVAAAGLRRGGFLTSEYTADKPDSGWLLAWSSRPVRKIMQPPPAGLRFRPNGWLMLADVDIDDLYLDGTGGTGSGQGRLRDAVRKLAIELRAMEVVQGWLVAQGHAEDDICDTSSSRPYDFEVGPEDRPLLRIEVKGLTGSLGPVEVTDGEVRSARGDVSTALAVVHSIQVTEDDDGSIIGSGGRLWLEHPWNPRDENLTPTHYRYALTGQSRIKA